MPTEPPHSMPPPTSGNEPPKDQEKIPKQNKEPFEVSEFKKNKTHVVIQMTTMIIAGVVTAVIIKVLL